MDSNDRKIFENYQYVQEAGARSGVGGQIGGWFSDKLQGLKSAIPGRYGRTAKGKKKARKENAPSI